MRLIYYNQFFLFCTVLEVKYVEKMIILIFEYMDY